MADGSYMPALTGAPVAAPLWSTDTFTATEDVDAKAVARGLGWFREPLPSTPPESPVAIARTRPAAVNRHERRRRRMFRGQILQFRPPRSEDARLTRHLGIFKMQVNRVAMHLAPALRRDLFDGLDGLMSPDNWDPDMTLPSEASLRTLLAFLVHLRPEGLPSLGASDFATFVASWRDDEADIFVDFRDDGQVRWVASRSAGDRRERMAGETEIASLTPGPASFVADRWFAPRG